MIKFLIRIFIISIIVIALLFVLKDFNPLNKDAFQSI